MANEHIFRVIETAKKTEVVLSAEEAAEAARLIRLLLQKAGEPRSQLESDVRSIESILSSRSRSADRTAVVRLARCTYVARRARERFVSGAMLGEPAWDMLLGLYLTDGGQRQTITTLTEHSGVPPTTALRWIEYLAAQGLAIRRPHVTDGRASQIEITDKGREALDNYFSALLEKEFADL